MAAAGQGSPNYHLTIVDLAGGPPRRLTNEPTSDVQWSPDGASLAAIVADRILLVDASGLAAPRELTRIPGRSLASLAWSPNGRHLLVTARPPTDND